MEPLVLAELGSRLRWFVRLRWLAVTGVATVVLALRGLGATELPLWQLLLVVATLAAVNTVYWLYLRGTHPRSLSERSALTMANLQIAVDLLFVTLLLHFLGGVENPFYLYYVFHVIIASILLPSLATYLQSTLAVVLFGGLVALEFSGHIPHFGVDLLGMDGAYRQGGYVLAVLAALTSTLYFAAYMATNIVHRLREREREVITLSERLQLDQERLRQAYERLQQTEAAKSRHLRKVGHQLRSPLGAVQALLSTLLDEKAEPLPQQSRDLVARARVRTAEMLHTVEDLLALSRASEARLGPVARPVALGETIRRVASLFAAEATAKGISLETSVPGQLPMLHGDPAGLEDLIVNLTANAIKYTTSGGTVRLSIDLADGRIVIKAADTGIGIAPHELPHIFDEFYRSDRAMRMAKEGTGLGLAIVRAVVEAHGGSIAVESALDKGTTFSISLPLHRAGGDEPDVSSANSARDPSDGNDERQASPIAHQALPRVGKEEQSREQHAS